MKNRLLVLAFLILFVILAFASCGDKTKPSTTAKTTDAPSTSIATDELNTASLEDEPQEPKLWFESNGDGTCTVIGIMSFDGTDLTIPSTSPEGDRVVGISNTFSLTGGDRLTSVTIPEGVTRIGGGAFNGCYALTSVTWNAINCACEDEKSSVFSRLPNLTTVTFGDRVEIIPSGAFATCKGVITITIPDSVTSIGERAFINCSGLTLITIPDKVSSIGKEAFRNCSGLISVTVGSGVTSIGENAFGDCYKLIEICNLSSLNITPGGSENGRIGEYAKHIYKDGDSYLHETDDGAFFYDDGTEVIYFPFLGTDTEVTLPAKLNGKNYALCQYAFHNRSDLTSVTIPDGITRIGDSAFSGCSGLTLITIPDGITSIGDYAFSGCSGLTSITIPNSVTSIGHYAFDNCSGLTSFIISKNVTSIGSGAFSNCSGLTRIILSNGLKSIERNTFYKCSKLTSISLPDGITYIGDNAFQDCVKLTSITIPDSVTCTGSSVFAGCGCLRFTEYENGFYIGNSMNPYHVLVYADYLPECPQFTIHENTKVICGGAFRGSYLASITIPDGVTSIGSYAFSGCSGLTSITIPDSVTSIGDSAFYNCSGLTSVSIPDSVTNVGGSAFEGCINLHYNVYNYRNYLGNSDNPYVVLISANNSQYITSTTFHENTRVIAGRAFYCCSKLASVTVHDGIRSIGNSAFYNCADLTAVTIPDSVTSIENSAFMNCTKLTSITFTGTIEDWNAISKGSSWDYNTGNYTIHCTDGDIAK